MKSFITNALLVVFASCAFSFVISSPSTSEKAISNGLECTFCKVVIGEAEKYLSNKSTEAEIEQVLDNVCNDLGPLKGECNNLVKTYLPVLVQYIQQGFGASKVCSLIHLC